MKQRANKPEKVTLHIEGDPQEKERVKQPENLFRHFIIRMSLLDPQKAQTLNTVFSRWLTRSFRAQKNSYRKFLEKNKESLDLFQDSVNGYLGYGLSFSIPNSAYTELDDIELGSEHEQIDETILDIADKIISNPDPFFKKLNTKISRIPQSSNFFEEGSSKKVGDAIFKAFILNYSKGPGTVFYGDHELPFGMAKEHYQVAPEYETIFELGRFGINHSNHVTSWQAFRYRAKFNRWERAKNDLEKRGQVYLNANPIPHHAALLSYFDDESKAYKPKLAAVEDIQIRTYTMKPFERACIHDFFTKFALPKEKSNQTYPSMQDVANLIEYLVGGCEEIEMGAIKQLGDVNKKHAEKKSEFSFPTNDFLAAFNDELPASVKVLFRTEHNVISTEKQKGNNRFLLEFLSPKPVRVWVELDPDFKSFEMTIFTVMGSSKASNNSKFVSERTLACCLPDNGPVILKDVMSPFNSALHSKIEQLAITLLENEDSSSPEYRQKINALFGKKRSELLTSDNLPYYVAAIKKLILDLIIDAAQEDEVKTHEQLRQLIGQDLEESSEIWNIIPTEELLNKSLAHQRNMVFEELPTIIPNQFQEKQISPEHLKNELKNKYSKGGNESLMTMFSFIFSPKRRKDEKEKVLALLSAPPEIIAILMNLAKYVESSGDDLAQYVRLVGLSTYLKLFTLEEEFKDKLINLPEDTEDARLIIGDFLGGFIRIIKEIHTSGGLRLLADINKLPKENQEMIKKFWRNMKKYMEITLKRAIEMSGRVWSDTALSSNPFYQMINCIEFINVIAGNVGQRKINDKWKKILIKKAVSAAMESVETIDPFEEEARFYADSGTSQGSWESAKKSKRKTHENRRSLLSKYLAREKEKIEINMELSDDEVEARLIARYAVKLVKRDERSKIESYAMKLVRQHANWALEREIKSLSMTGLEEMKKPGEKEKRLKELISLYNINDYRRIMEEEINKLVQTDEFRQRISVSLEQMNRVLKRRMKLVQDMKEEIKIANKLISDLKSAFSEKKGRALIAKYASTDLEFLMEILLSNIDHVKEAAFGDILIFVFNKLGDRSIQINFLEKLNLLPYFYRKQDGENIYMQNNEKELVSVSDPDPESLPTALKKLFEHLNSAEYSYLPEIITDYVQKVSRESHDKEVGLSSQATLV